MIIHEVLEFDDLNKEAKETQDLEKAAEIIKQYKDIIKTKKKGIINVAYHQGRVLKRFLRNEKFVTLATIIFKINVFKLCKKYSKTIDVFYSLKIFLKTAIRSLKQFARKIKKIFNIERFCLLKLSL